MSGHWYDADDATPGDGDEVLVTGFREKTTERYKAISTYDEEDDKFYFYDPETDTWWEYIGVTHWQYLPDTDDL